MVLTNTDELRLFDLSGIPRSKSRFSRVLLKLSGEALAGNTRYGIDAATTHKFAEEIATAKRELGVEIAIVVGGGNIWRGAQHPEMDPAQADYAGMLATVMNALSLQDHLEKLEQPTRVMSAIHMAQVAEPYIRRRAIRHMEKDRVVIFAGGTGSPTFTTDTTASLRAVEVEADVLLMAKNGVDGIYTGDPKHEPNAQRLNTIKHFDLLNLDIMDATAVTHAHDNNLTIIVFDGLKEGCLIDILTNPNKGTIVH